MWKNSVALVRRSSGAGTTGRMPMVLQRRWISAKVASETTTASSTTAGSSSATVDAKAAAAARKQAEREAQLERIRESNRKKAEQELAVSAESLISRRINPATGEIGGPSGPEPTRHGDWHKGGRVTDF